MNPLFIAAVFPGVFARHLAYCPVCWHYRVCRAGETGTPKICDVCGSDLEPVQK